MAEPAKKLPAEKPVPPAVKVLRGILEALRFVNKQIGSHPAATARLDELDQLLVKLEHPEEPDDVPPVPDDDDEAKPRTGGTWSRRHGKEAPSR